MSILGLTEVEARDRVNLRNQILAANPLAEKGQEKKLLKTLIQVSVLGIKIVKRICQ